MIAFALTAWRWLAAGNWTWAVPTAITVALALYAGTQRIAYLDCKADRAADHLAAERAKAEALADAQRRSDAIVTEQAAALAATAQKAGTFTERIIRVPVTNTCAASDPVRIGIDGVRAILGAGRRDAEAERRAPPAVR